jgi:hypothetical protein
MLSLRTRRAAIVVALLLLVVVLGVACAGASACPNETSPGFRAYLPDCRAYELVSPEYKEASKIAIEEMSEGGALRIESLGNFSAPENLSGFGNSYLLSRDPYNWTASSLTVPFSSFSGYSVWAMSSDFGRSFWFAGAPGHSLENPYLGSPGGPLTLVGPGGPGTVLTGLSFIGASDDLLHVLFRDRSPGSEEENQLWPGDTTDPGRIPSLYEYAGTGNAEPRLVGVSNEESMEEAALKKGEQHINEAANLISNCGTSLGSAQEEDAYNAVSASGMTVFFTAEACGSPPVDEVYARLSGERTIAISEPLLSVPGRICTGACATAESVPGDRQAGLFAGASLDGSRVYFLTRQSLVNGDENGDGSGMDLYEAEITGGVVSRLAQVSRGGSGDPTPGSGADVLGVARVSEDGSHVYFVAEGVLTGANKEGKTPVVGQPNLYLVTTECSGGGTACVNPVEHTSFVATLSAAGDGGDWSSRDVRPVQATPYGDFLVFQSTAHLTPGNPQVFEYDAQTEALVQISRGATTATMPVQNYQESLPDERFTDLALSSDGSRVFFSSDDALTPQALEGFENVYEYHEGQISLISDGHDTQRDHEFFGPQLIGTDESGQDVFFTTADSLVPQDSDTHVDVYDARIDGGFPGPVAPAACEGDTCQEASNPPPLPPFPDSMATEGGNLASTVTKPTVRSLTRAQKLATALKVCRAKHNKHERAGCEAQARKKYGAHPKAKKASLRVGDTSDA